MKSSTPVTTTTTAAAATLPESCIATPTGEFGLTQVEITPAAGHPDGAKTVRWTASFPIPATGTVAFSLTSGSVLRGVKFDDGEVIGIYVFYMDEANVLLGFIVRQVGFADAVEAEDGLLQKAAGISLLLLLLTGRWRGFASLTADTQDHRQLQCCALTLREHARTQSTFPRVRCAKRVAQRACRTHALEERQPVHLRRSGRRDALCCRASRRSSDHWIVGLRGAISYIPEGPSNRR